MARSTCSACSTVFASVSAFDAHRTGAYSRGGQRRSTRRCLTTAELRAVGLIPHPTKTHAGKPVWVQEVSVERWEVRKAILRDTHMQELAS